MRGLQLVKPNSHNHAYLDSKCHRYRDLNGHRNGHRHGLANGDTDCHGDRDGDAYGYANL